MSCEDLIIVNDINDPCSPVMGRYTEAGFVYDYNDINQDPVFEVDGIVTLSLINGAVGVRVYDRSTNPFTGVTRESENNDRYVVFHDKAVIPLFVNNQINAKLVNVFGKKRVVLVLEHLRTGTNDDARYPIFGIKGGLLEQSTVHDPQGSVAHEATFIDMNTGYPAYFLQATTNGFTEKKLKALANEEYNYLSGGIVATGNTIAYGVNGGSKLWVRFPDGTSQEFGSAVSQVWAGAPGTTEVVVLKSVNTLLESTSVGLTGVISSNVAGELRVPQRVGITDIYASNAITLTANSCTALRTASCPKATAIDLQGNNLKALAIANMLLEIYAEGKTNGNITLQGGTNATQLQVAAVSPAANAAIDDMRSTRAWNITFNMP